MSVIEDLLKGSIDMHMHAGPDPHTERRLDALQAAQMAQEAGMRAIVLKSHEYPTAPLAYILNQLVPGVTVVGSIALDFELGGLNPYAVEASAKLGARVVWMPTFSSDNDMKKKGSDQKGIALIDDKGKLLPVLHEIMDIIKQYDMVLGTGHISIEESFALVKEATAAGLKKITVTHPLAGFVGAALSTEQQKQMAEQGAYIEHCFMAVMPSSGLPPAKMVEAIKAVGAEHCILSTDLGQSHNPAPTEGMRMAIATMLMNGLTVREIEFMVKENPRRLLNLE